MTFKDSMFLHFLKKVQVKEDYMVDVYKRQTFTDIFGFVPLAPPRVIFRVIRREFGAMAYFVGNVIMPAVIGIDAQFTLFFGGPAVYRPGIVGVKPWASKPVGVLAQPTNCDIGR